MRAFFHSEAASGALLVFCAILGVAIANSPLSAAYFSILHLDLGPLSLQHWINDALMAIFFLLVGLEIKREMVEGHLSSWSSRILPGAGAAAGMAAPALIYLAFNPGGPSARGWAIPTATDIAFALGVLSLLGSRVPTSLKVFLAALAIFDDLGAIIIIGLFYSAAISPLYLAAAGMIFLMLLALNRMGATSLRLYLPLGLALWFFTYHSGLHATISGVLLAMAIPARSRAPAIGESSLTSPLQRLEHILSRPVAFLIMPIFGLANAGVVFPAFSVAMFSSPVVAGIALGLSAGKAIGIFSVVFLLTRLKLAVLPSGASLRQMLGLSLLCGVGFTMSLFISTLAFADPDLQGEGKIGILTGSLLSCLLGYLLLRLSSQPHGAAMTRSGRPPAP